MFGKRVPLFTLLGFEVRVDLSWIVIASLVTWSLAVGFFPATVKGHSPAVYWWMGAAGMLGLFGSIIVHELAHSLVARRYGLPMNGITLFIFGGVAEMDDEPPSAKAEGLMAIAGPIVSIGLALACTSIASYGQNSAWPDPVIGILRYLGFINRLVAIFNLIPAFPLDGGRVLRSALWAWKGNLRWATRVASRLGTGFSFLLMAWGVLTLMSGDFIGGLWRLLIGIFLGDAARASYQQLTIRHALGGESVQRFMQPSPITVPPNLTVQELVDDYIYAYHFKMFPVVNRGQVAGCVSTRNVKQLPQHLWKQHTVQDILAPCSRDNTIGPRDDALDALTQMNQTGLSRLMVIDDNQLVGVIALKDLMAFLALKEELGNRED